MLRTCVGARALLWLVLGSLLSLGACTRLLPAEPALDGGAADLNTPDPDHQSLGDLAGEERADLGADSAESPADINGGVADLGPPAATVITLGGSKNDVLRGLVATGGTIHVGGGFKTDLQVDKQSFTSNASHLAGFIVSYGSPMGIAPRVRLFDATIQCLVHSLALDDQQRLYAGGIAHGTVTFGGAVGIHKTASRQQAFVLALDGAAQARWLRAYKGTSNFQGHDLDWHLTAGLVAGGLYQSSAVANFGALSLPASNPHDDPFALTLSTSGLERWVYAPAGQGFSGVDAIAFRADGGVCMAGHMVGDAIFVKTATASPGQGGNDAFVVALDASGTVLWWRHFGAKGDDRALGVAAAGNDCVAVGRISGAVDLGEGTAVPFVGGSDAYAVRYAANDGAVRWKRMIAGTGTDMARDVALLPNGDVAVVGSFTGDVSAGLQKRSSAGSSDGFLVILDGNSGGVKVLRREGGLGADVLNEVTVDGVTGELVVGGLYSGTIAVLGQTLKAVGLQDIFVVRLP